MQLANIAILLVPLPFLFLVFWSMVRDLDRIDLPETSPTYKFMVRMNMIMLSLLLIHLWYFIASVPDLLQ